MRVGVDLGGVAGELRVRDIEVPRLGRQAGPVTGGLGFPFWASSEDTGGRGQLLKTALLR